MKREARILVVGIVGGCACGLVVRACRLIDWGVCGESIDEVVDAFMRAGVRHETRYYYCCNACPRSLQDLQRVDRLECGAQICGMIVSLVRTLLGLALRSV